VDGAERGRFGASLGSRASGAVASYDDDDGGADAASDAGAGTPLEPEPEPEPNAL